MPEASAYWIDFNKSSSILISSYSMAGMPRNVPDPLSLNFGDFRPRRRSPISEGFLWLTTNDDE